MKLTTILLLAFVIQVSARVTAQNITYTGKAVALQEVFTAIKAQTGYKFFYRNEDLAEMGKVTVALKGVSLEKALQLALEGKPLQFVIEGKTIFISKKKAAGTAGLMVMDMSAVQQETGDVTGMVKDAAGKPLAGVTVMAKRGHGVTASDEQGEFVLHSIHTGDTIVFSSIGFETTSLPAVFAGRLVVVMRPHVAELASFVVYNTGYQRLTKERATGAFAKPDMEIFRNRVATNDIISRLDGQVAGLTLSVGKVTENGSQNGVKTNRSVIRGIGSVSQDTDPLYVVNGIVVSDFATVNPQDIDDITVLKDAAAAAIYGSKAANGVIVVRTKEGRKSQKLQIEYSGNLNYQGKPDFDYLKMMNTAQFIQSAKETFAPEINPYESFTYGFLAPHSKIMYDQYRGLITEATANQKLDSLAAISNTSQVKDLFYRNAMTTNHTLSASGGNDIYSFYASLGYTGTQINRAGAKNNSYRVNVTQQINAGKSISISLNTSLINDVTSNDGSAFVAPDFLPYQLFRDAAGKDIDLAYTRGYSDELRADYAARSRINLNYYPLQEAAYGRSRTNNLHMNLTGNVSVKLLKGLSYSGTYGYVKSPGNTEKYTDNKAYSQRMSLISFTIAPTVNDIPQYLLPVNGGGYTNINTDQRNWTVRNQLLYAASFRNGKDLLSVQAGQEAREDYTSNRTTTLFGYDEALGTSALVDYATLSRGVFGTVTGYGFLNSQGPYAVRTVLSRFNSYFGLASYTFDRKYSLDASWRRDHSNLFGSDVSAQNKPAYSIGAKWKISGEAFMQRIKWINELGLRATYGVTGNSPYVGIAASSDVLEAVPQSNSGGIAGDAFQVSTVANRRLSWEASKTVNIGLDFTVLNGRIGGGFNFYNKTTTDMIASVPLNRFSGFERASGNLGTMVNSGIELNIHTGNIQGKNFGWTTNFVFSHNSNKLKSIGVVSANAYSNTLYGRLYASYIVDYPMQTLFAYRYAGLDNMGDPQIYLADKTVTKNPNGAAVQDLVYMGTYQPVYNGGMTNTFRYKGVSLAVNMVYSLGHVMRRDVNMLYNEMLASGSGFGGQNIPVYFLNRWKQPGDEARTNIPSYDPDYAAYDRRNTDYYRYADINVVSASYIKVRDLTLAYELQPAFAARYLKMQRVSLFVQATNFMVWKANHDDIDPEFHDPSSGGRIIPPYKHSYSVGLNITL